MLENTGNPHFRQISGKLLAVIVALLLKQIPICNIQKLYSNLATKWGM